jgi:hypothetical protein
MADPSPSFAVACWLVGVAGGYAAALVIHGSRGRRRPRSLRRDVVWLDDYRRWLDDYRRGQWWPEPEDR